MFRQRLLVLSSWAVTTMVATAVSAAGVSIVTRDVTDDHSPALGQADVVALLSAPIPTTTPPPASTTTETVPPPSPSTTVAPTTLPPAAPSTSPPTLPPATTAAPTTRVPPLTDALSATFSAEGGTMTVACLGDTIALVSARPNDGYQLVVYDDGMARVRVQFERDGGEHRNELESVCFRGEPVLAAGHDPRRLPDGGDDRDGDGRDSGSRGGNGAWDGGGGWGG